MQIFLQYLFSFLSLQLPLALLFSLCNAATASHSLSLTNFFQSKPVDQFQPVDSCHILPLVPQSTPFPWCRPLCYSFLVLPQCPHSSSSPLSLVPSPCFQWRVPNMKTCNMAIKPIPSKVFLFWHSNFINIYPQSLILSHTFSQHKIFHIFSP